MAYAYTGTVFAAPLAERKERPTVLSQIINAMIESRMHTAQRQINAHRHLFEDSALILNNLPAATLQSDARPPCTG
ncbi:MAG: hypothetical protein NTZ14_16610 [Hyphomicrobiales bacterium]|nr:hypothetical protein [Hyphomicrobiales bacterium]